LPVRHNSIGRHEPQVEAAIYYCCLEAVQNATKHAGAGARVVITLAPHGDALDVTIADDGPGFDLIRDAEGTGLVSMCDRIGAVGGELEIASSPGTGTKIRAHVPHGAASTERDSLHSIGMRIAARTSASIDWRACTHLDRA
jgi:signal transduction histidine kinase